MIRRQSLTWIAQLSHAAAGVPVQFLDAMIDRPWVPDANKSILYRQLVDNAQARVSQKFGDQQSKAQNILWTLRDPLGDFPARTRRGSSAALETAAGLLAEAARKARRSAAAAV